MKFKGLIFKKFDLHIHTPASKCFVDKFEDDISAAQAIVAESIKKDLAAIAITDHNTGRFIDIVKSVARDTELVVFPGVEITVGDAHNHVIAILDIDRTTNDIEDLLMAVGIPNNERGKEYAFSKKSVIEVIDIITSEPFNGIAILAHIDSTNGVFEQMRGGPRIKVIQHPKLIAVEAVNYDKVAKLLNGKDPNYRRKLAVYQASDNPCLDKNGKIITSGKYAGRHCIAGIGFRYSYFKVDQNISLESLRQCFIDPDVRVRQSWEYKDEVYPYIKRVKINSGFLNEVEAVFHSGLNSILGAKGVGKSLLIEFIRFALDQEPSHEEIRIDHATKLEEQLGQYGEVEVLICDETGKEFLIKRTYDPSEDNPIQCVDLSNNEIIDVNISQLFPILALSQNEIIKIAEDKKEEQMKFIDKFFDFYFYTNQISILEKELEDLDREFASAIRAYHEHKRLKKQLVTAKLELGRLTKQLKNPIFAEIAKYEQKDKIFRIQEEYLNTLKDYLEQLVNIISNEDIPPLEDELRNDPALKRNLNILKKTKTELLDVLKSQKKEIEKSSQDISLEYQKWLPLFNQRKDKLKEIVLKLGGDVQILEQRRKDKIREIENIEKKLTAIQSKSSQIKEIFKRRNQKLEELKQIYSSYFNERKNKCKFFEKASNGKLKIEIIESSNRDEFKKSLMDLKRGSYLRNFEIEQICEKITPYEFILELLRYDLLRNDAPEEASKKINEISTKTELPFEKIKGLVDYILSLIENRDLDYEDLLKLQYKAYPVDRPIIKYNLGNLTNPKYESLDKISTGQKCTAMLILALSDGKMPIIIDQPEDSLDIRAIWEDMCKKIRTGKEKRQFVFTTHNSSVAVASDSDKFIIMTGTALRGEIIYAGSIDNEKIRKEIIKYLEGGLTTYKLKFLKYNISKLLKEIDNE